MDNEKVCLITFSNNADHQNVIYSMFNALYPRYNVYTIGISNPKSLIAPNTDNNLYVHCPLRPGITKGTFNFKVLREIKKWIKKNDIQYLYFESQHLWNMFLMMTCRKPKKIVAVHDVIPHDGNKFMALSNYVTCHLSDRVVLRNKLFTEELAAKYHLKKTKISNFEMWRDYPDYSEPLFTGTFLYFGRIRKYKGFDLLAKIIEKTPNINYRIVGEADLESKPLVDLVKNFPNVSIKDVEVTENEMIEEFKSCDWVILPYSSATQSGVIADAYRLSKPVISFDVGALSEQIIDKETGFIVEKENVEMFIKRIIEANQMSEKDYKAFTKNAYSFGFERYSANARSDDFIGMLISK